MTLATAELVSLFLAVAALLALVMLAAVAGPTFAAVQAAM